MKHITVLIFAASSLLLAGCSTMHEHAKVWEYKTVDNPTDQQLNQLAEQGWRIKSFSASGTGTPYTVYLLEKKKQ